MCTLPLCVGAYSSSYNFVDMHEVLVYAHKVYLMVPLEAHTAPQAA